MRRHASVRTVRVGDVLYQSSGKILSSMTRLISGRDTPAATAASVVVRLSIRLSMRHLHSIGILQRRLNNYKNAMRNHGKGSKSEVGPMPLRNRSVHDQVSRSGLGD